MNTTTPARKAGRITRQGQDDSRTDRKKGIPRPVEAIIALVCLIAVGPVIALSAFAIAVTSRGGAFFRQKRIGKEGRPFVLFKLRTMRVFKVGPQVTAGDDVRITLVGRLLRRMKLDELPEFWNVLIGDMSLVGPRPEVPRYVDLRDLRWQTVLRARPGLTDPVTLRLRNEERLLAGVGGDVEFFYVNALQPLKLNGYLEYLEKRSWKADLKVLLETAMAVILPGHRPAPTVAQVLAEVSTLIEKFPLGINACASDTAASQGHAPE